MRESDNFTTHNARLNHASVVLSQWGSGKGQVAAAPNTEEASRRSEPALPGIDGEQGVGKGHMAEFFGCPLHPGDHDTPSCVPRSCLNVLSFGLSVWFHTGRTLM